MLPATNGDRRDASRGSLDRSELFEAVHALLEATGAPGPVAARGGGRALGRPVDPGHAELPVRPHLRLSGGDRGLLPGRRPAPPAPAAGPGRRVATAARGGAAAPGTAGGRCGPRADRLPAPRPDGRGSARRDRRPVGGQPVLRRGAGGGDRRPGPPAAHRPGRGAAGPDRPARRADPAGGAGGQRGGPAGEPRPAGRSDRSGRAGARGGAPAGGGGERPGHPAVAHTRSGTPCWPRRPTTTSCPASGSGCTPRTPTRSAWAGPAGRPPSWPGTPGWRWTTRPRSTPASGPAGRRCRSVVPTRRRGTSSRPCSCSPTRDEDRVDVDLAQLLVDTAEALLASGHPMRADALLAEQLARLPADAPAAWRPRLLAARAEAMIRLEPDEDPRAISAEAVRLLPPGPSGVRAAVLAVHARILAAYGRFDEAQPTALEALTLAEQLELEVVASDAITTLSGLKRFGPAAELRRALTDAVERAVDDGRGAGGAARAGSCSAGRSRITPSGTRRSPGTGAWSPGARRRTCPGRRTSSTPAGSWPGSTGCGAAGTSCSSSPTTAARPRRGCPGCCWTCSGCRWSSPAASGRRS